MQSNPFKRIWQRAKKYIGLFSLCLFLAVSCTTVETETGISSVNTGRVTIGTTLKIRTLDPADAYESLSGNLLYNLGDRLYTYAAGTTNLIPQLATSLPQISSDNLTYKIPLRQGVKFHDGTPFNAEAMVFSLKRFQENQGAPSSLLKDVESIQATGDYELTIKLKQPFAAFPSLLTFSGLCALSPQAYEIGEGKFNSNTFVGTGPYKLVSLGTDRVRLDPFEQYWGEKPQNQGINIQLFTSGANLFNAFRTGAVDVAANSLTSDQILGLEKQKSQKGWQEITATGNTLYYITLNVKSPPLDQPEVRQALAAVIDRPLLNQRVLLDQGQPNYSLIPASFPNYDPVFDTEYGDANFEQAKQLLTQAGFSKTNPAIVELWYSANNTERSLVANTIKAIVAKNMEGILQIELNSVDSTTAFQNLDKGVYPTFILDWYADFFDPDNYIQPFLDCSEGTLETGCTNGASHLQGSFYYNPRVNQLIAKQRQELNPNQRQNLLIQIQEILVKDVPFIPLWLDRDYLFTQNNIQGVRLEPTQQFPFSPIQKS